MISLQEERRGAERGVPTVALASAALDNIYCITAFSIASNVAFSRTDAIAYTAVKIPVELLMGGLVGVASGLVLRVFPRPSSPLVHFTRATLLFSACIAQYFGGGAINCWVAGPVAVLLGCVVADMR